MKQAIILIFVMLLNLSCSDPVKPEKPENHRPQISSVTVVPKVVSPSDSVVITCYASDPDKDTLVYDWITDGRLHIKGTSDREHSLYNTFENSHVFYPNNWRNVDLDTPWVQCFARDRRGMSDAVLVQFIMKK
ncbi:MAG: hypothetical protein HF314_02755 [Ignavibacteria bacterium]|nr:hypothetical protein [Ignavibacteria bacterium]MCU7501968.1 hypothetical protein [Ignavibacteria bacterium]MCU7516936.1 hypothetical protein [Ignavibacteria bacterium]